MVAALKESKTGSVMRLTSTTETGAGLREKRSTQFQTASCEVKLESAKRILDGGALSAVHLCVFVAEPQPVAFWREHLRQTAPVLLRVEFGQQPTQTTK